MKTKIIAIGVCTLFIAGMFPMIGYTSQAAGTQNTLNWIFSPNDLVRIDTSQGTPVLPRGIEIAGGNPGKWIDIILPRYRLGELSTAQIPYSVLISDVDAYSDSYRGQYHTLAQVEQQLQTIAAAYPSITELYSIGTTYQSRQIWCLEISDNPGVDEGEPGVFFMGLHHAREWPTVEICLTIANRLTSLYASNQTIRNLVNNRRVWLVVCCNPDGYYRSHDQGYDWRKNMHYFPEYGTTGVDLNRNYGGSSNGDAWGAWGSLGYASVSHNPDSEVYCGPGAMSEYEVQAIRNIFLQNDICASITWHTYSELVMWPWGYSTGQQTPDNTYLSQVGQQIASRITRDYGSGTYTPQQSAQLYPTTGDTTDWAYGSAHYLLGRTTFTYTIEACSDFQPPSSMLDQICNENYDGALYLLQEAQNIKNTVMPRVIPPVLNEIQQQGADSYNVSWVEQNPAANPDVFQLDELTELILRIETAEAGTSDWTLNGFALSTSRYHSATHSFKSRYQSEDVSSMTSIYPLPVTEGMWLSFWCWYNIEDDWDYAFVEVSTNGRNFDVLGKYTGSSGGWVMKEYDLAAYVGKSVFIRFRYTTDYETIEEGFYVDDITPVPHFNTVTTLSNTIPTNYYILTGKPDGEYYYRVKGHNTARGWGDFSTLEYILVEHIGPSPEFSFVTLTNENMPHLFTCPAGDGPTYQHVKITVRDAYGDPMSGIPADSFTFNLGTIDAIWYGTLSCTFTAVDTQTNVNGEIRFTVKGDTSIYGNITIKASIQGMELYDTDVLPCKTSDYFCDGAVILGDFVVFGQDYGRVRWRSDFSGDGGFVGLGDFVMFGQHYSHHA